MRTGASQLRRRWRARADEVVSTGPVEGRAHGGGPSDTAADVLDAVRHTPVPALRVRVGWLLRAAGSAELPDDRQLACGHYRAVERDELAGSGCAAVGVQRPRPGGEVRGVADGG